MEALNGKVPNDVFLCTIICFACACLHLFILFICVYVFSFFRYFSVFATFENNFLNCFLIPTAKCTRVLRIRGQTFVEKALMNVLAATLALLEVSHCLDQEYLKLRCEKPF